MKHSNRTNENTITFNNNSSDGIIITIGAERVSRILKEKLIGAKKLIKGLYKSSKGNQFPPHIHNTILTFAYINMMK